MNIQTIRNHLDSLYQQQQYEVAHQYLLENIELARIHEDSILELACLNDLLGYYRIIAHEPRGYAVARQIEKMLKPLEVTLDQIVAYQNLATFYSAFDDLEAARRCYEICYKFYEKQPQLDLIVYASFLNNYSLFLQKNKQLEKAIEIQELAISIIEQQHDTEIELATSLANLAGMLEHLDLLKAHQTYQKSIHLFMENDPLDPHYMGTLINAGVFYQYHHSNQRALHCFEQAYPLTQKLNVSYSHDLYHRIEQLKSLESTRSQPAIKGTRDFFENFFLPALQVNYPEAYDKLSIGLVGRGSECFSLDDSFSWDHDLSYHLCIFIDQEDQAEWFDPINELYSQLSKRYLGDLKASPLHRGVIVSETFYINHLGRLPVSSLDWLTINEHALATATNGELFHNQARRFKEIRQTLLEYYPEDVWIKKIAGCFARMSQSGQYNYPRAMMRQDIDSAEMARYEFIKSALSLFYLLNRTYQPFYKWSLKIAETLPEIPHALTKIKEVLHQSLQLKNWEDFPFPHALNKNDKTLMNIESICQLMIDYCFEIGLVSHQDPFLQSHIVGLIEKIKDKDIAQRHVMED